jgi:hypothetical protein
MKKGYVAISILIALALLVGGFTAAMAFAPQTKTDHVANLFVDVNHDGQADLIVSGEVILNSGTPLPSK